MQITLAEMETRCKLAEERLEAVEKEKCDLMETVKMMESRQSAFGAETEALKRTNSELERERERLEKDSRSNTETIQKLQAIFKARDHVVNDILI